VKRRLALLPLLALVVLATACGTRDALELDPVASAASKTDEAGSSRVAFEARTIGLGRDFVLKGEGAFDYEAGSGTLQLDASALVPGAGDGRIELRSVGSKLFLRVPESLAAWLPTPKRWVALGVGKSLDAFGLGSVNPNGLQQDPAELLRLLRASSAEVKESGSAVVRGVGTTRYTAKLDLAKAVDANAESLGLTERERAQLRQAVEELRRESGLDAIPVEVYIDSEGMLRRTSLTLTLELEGRRVSLAQTTDYYDFGADVDVQAPPASQVLDLNG